MTLGWRQVLAVLLLVGVRASAERPKVLLVPWASGEGVSEKATERFQGLVADELQGRAELEIDRLQTPAEAMERGSRALELLHFDEAASAFRQAMELAMAEPTAVQASLLTQGYLGLATAFFRLGEEGAAKETLLALACFAPSLKLASTYPPIFRREFDKAKKRAQRRGHAQLAVDGPKDATVQVDGRELGRLPILIDWPIPGRHLVRVEGAGGEHFARLVDLGAGLTKVFATFSASATVIDEAQLLQLAALTQAQGSAYALVGAVTRSSGTQLTAALALFGRAQNAVVALEPVVVEADEALARPQLRAIGEELAHRLSRFGAPSALPLSLAVRLRPQAPAPPPASLVPQPVGDVPATSLAAAPTVKAPANPGPPTWVYVVGGVAVAAGLGVGGYFGIRELTRPVTGTVSASW